MRLEYPSPLGERQKIPSKLAPLYNLTYKLLEQYLVNVFTMTALLRSIIFSAYLSIFVVNLAIAQQVSSGKLETVSPFKSEFIKERTVRIWLPDGYSTDIQYSVLYMHDGQMLFDATTTWNKQEWGVDEVAGKLQALGEAKPFIVVAIDNGGALRYPEYLPQKPWEALSTSAQHDVLNATPQRSDSHIKNVIQSDNYLKFLVSELKPYIDRTYSVLTDRDNTFVAGSSMGGLISMYAISEYPTVFGAAACISTHWPGSTKAEWTAITDQFMSYVKTHIPAPGVHRIYFDYGDQTLDAVYPPMQQQVDTIMRAKGYDASNWLTVYDKGAAHTETDWQARLDKPLLFLLGK